MQQAAAASRGRVPRRTWLRWCRTVSLSVAEGGYREKRGAKPREGTLREGLSHERSSATRSYRRLAMRKY